MRIRKRGKVGGYVGRTLRLAADLQALWLGKRIVAQLCINKESIS